MSTTSSSTRNSDRPGFEAKKLAIFLPGLHGGGAERSMLNLAAGLASDGHAVDLVLVKAEGPYLNQVPASVRVLDLEASRTLAALPSLVRYLRSERPEAMVSALSRANLLGLLARRLTGLPRLLVVNEQNTMSQSAQNLSDWQVRIVPFLARRFYRWATAVVSVSQAVADDLVQVVGIPRELVSVIYNPGVVDEMRAKARQPVEHPWFQGDQPPVVLSVGSLTVQKDYETLLRAFAEVRKKSRARLLILGEGRQREKLEQLVRDLGLEEDVLLPGFADNPYSYMACAAVFVLPSRWEGLPTVLVEALYCGASVVATDAPGGSREILRDGELGQLVPIRQPAALARAIQRALDGQAPKPTPDCWKPYAVETVVGQYLELLFEPSSS